jgi:1,4-dihydroxy-2-naphthoate octaprenyltransferase
VNPADSTDAPSALATWVSAARPRTLPAAVAPVLVGSALAARHHAFQPMAAGLCLAFALLVQVGTNFANDYYDFLKGADTPERVGPRRAVAAGLVPPGTMKAAMIGVFAAAFAVGLGLLPYGGPGILAVGLASIACGYAYTGGPWPLAYLGLGDLFVFLFFGLVAVAGTDYVQAGRLSREAILAGTGVGLLAANILVVNNYRDVETDAKAGKRTLVVQFGRGFARLQFGISLAGAFLVPVVFALLGRGAACLLPLVLLPLAWIQFRRLACASGPAELVSLLGAAGRLAALYAALFASGLLL